MKVVKILCPSLRRISMKLTIMSLVVVLVLNTCGIAYGAEPQDAKLTSATTQRVEKVKSEIQKRGVGEQSRVKVRLHDRTEVKGYISQVDATSFQLTDRKTGKISTISYEMVDKVGGRGLSTGAKIGIGIGVGVGITVTVFALIVASWHGN
jgi:hypothetical protein